MVFNAGTGLTLVKLTNQLVKTTNGRYPLDEKAGNASWAVRIIMGWIARAYGGWIYDDANQTDLPEAITTLKANQQFYPFPVDAQAIYSVEYLDSNSSWYPLKKITLEEIKDKGYAEAEFMNTPGYPVYYRPVANGFKLYPASDTERASGLKANVSREEVEFTAESTDMEPGFDSILHEAVAVFMALQYADINNLKYATKLQKRWDGNVDQTGVPGGYMKAITLHYQQKFRENFPPQAKKTGPRFADQFVS